MRKLIEHKIAEMALDLYQVAKKTTLEKIVGMTDEELLKLFVEYRLSCERYR